MNGLGPQLIKPSYFVDSTQKDSFFIYLTNFYPEQKIDWRYNKKFWL